MPPLIPKLVLLGALAGTLVTAVLADSNTTVIDMKGTPRGERVWFDPVGLVVEAGTTIEFINGDPVNSHTATLYHPDNNDNPLRAPVDAETWTSGFIMPGESFTVTLTEPGVYDYFCLPHELAGMAGRIIVVTSDSDEPMPISDKNDSALPMAVLESLPAITDILESGRVQLEDAQ